MQCKQICPQIVCSLLILHPLPVNNTSHNCSTFAFIVNKIFAVCAMRAPSLLHSIPLHPDGSLAWWEGTYPPPPDGRISGTTSTHSISGLSQRQSYLPVQGNASRHKYALCSNPCQPGSVSLVSHWPGALMRVRPKKGTIIVFIPAVLDSWVFSVSTHHEGLKPDPAEVVWMPHLDLFLIPVVLDAI